MKTGAMPEWKKEKLSELGITTDFHLKNKREELWEKRYAQYKAKVSESGVPSQKGSKTDRFLYFWQATEKKAIKNGMRSKKQIKLLKQVGIVAPIKKAA